MTASSSLLWFSVSLLTIGALFGGMIAVMLMTAFYGVG
jgi:hypothetical protein